MRGYLPNSMRKPDPQGLVRTIGKRLRLNTLARSPLVVGGMFVTGPVLVLLFGLDQLGVKIPAIDSEMFGGYEVGMSGILMAGGGSIFGRFSKKSSDGGKSRGLGANEPGSTMVLSTVRSNSVWLVVRSGMNPGQVLDINGDRVVIGSGMGSDVRIEDESVSESHALIKEIDGMYMVSDLGTRTGTWVNGKLYSGVVLKEGSNITIGTTKLTFYQTYGKVKNGDSEETQIIGGTLIVKAGSNIGESFQVGLGDTVIGSDPGESGIELEDRTVSKRHVMLRVMSKVCRLYDVGSTNGTDVDGTKFDGVPLKDGDVIKFGKVEVRFVRESLT